jgi:acyl-homoserine lactone acylase PvdQ
MQGIERILGLSTVLELTDAQVQNLNTLRVQGLERREALRGEMARIRSDLAAGQVTREEARERMETLRAENPRNAAAQPVQELLTEEQRTKLQELARSGRRGELQGRGGLRGGGPAAPGGERGRRR